MILEIILIGEMLLMMAKYCTVTFPRDKATGA